MESFQNGASAPPLFARVVRDFGSGKLTLIVTVDNVLGRSYPITEAAVDLARKLIANDGRGVSFAALSKAEVGAISELAEFGIRTRHAVDDMVRFAHTVGFADQRAVLAEVA